MARSRAIGTGRSEHQEAQLPEAGSEAPPRGATEHGLKIRKTYNLSKFRIFSPRISITQCLGSFKLQRVAATYRGQPGISP